ncbi:MAG: condensation domain-containing protein [Mycobacterium sp.]
MVAIGSISGNWTPGRGIVTEWTASSSSRELAAAASVDPLPPTFQQKQHLRSAHTARELRRSSARLILTSWNVAGWCDIAAMTEAINAHLRRHDTYHSAFDVTDEGDVIRRTIDCPERIEFVPAVLGLMEQDEIREHVQTATPNTLEWDCFTFGVIQKEHHFTFYANIDHLHTDGTSSLVIYGDITRDYQALTLGRDESDAEPAAYRDFTEQQHDEVETLTRDSAPVKDWVDFALDAEGEWPSFPLELGNADDGSGGAFTAEILNAEQTEAFDTACRRAGARFSGGVLACAAIADHDFTHADTVHIFSPLDTRTRDQATSVGWYASLFPISVDVTNDFGETARSAQKSFDANKHLAAVPFDRVLDLVDADELDTAGSSRPMMVSLFDFRKLDPAIGDNLGMFIDDLNHGGINIWVTRNRESTTVTVSFPETFDSRRSIHNYIAALRDAFISVAGG